VPVDAAVQQQPEAVVVEVAEAVAGSLDLLDQQVHHLGRAVGDAAVVEVGEQLVAPGVDSHGEAVQLRDIGVGAMHPPPVQPPPSLVAGLGAVEQPQVLGGDPGGSDLSVDVADVEPGQQPVPGQVGQVLVPAAQDPPLKMTGLCFG